MSKRKRLLIEAILICAIFFISVKYGESKPIFETEKNETNQFPQALQPSGIYLKHIRVSGIRLENVHDVSSSPFLGYTENHHSIVKPGEPIQLIIFGTGFNDFGAITFTADRSCNDRQEFIESDFSIITNDKMSITISFLELKQNEVYHLCVSERIDRKKQQFVVVEDAFTVITTRIPPKVMIMPLYLSIPILSILLVLSGLFSGLNLGLMTLSPFELQLYTKSGTPKERSWAEKIYPIRKRGNILLCTLLIGNVLVNSAISLLLDDIFGNGAYALILATTGITIFGEIIPQAICVKRGLEVGAKTVPLTRVIVFLMYPVTYFIALLLDYFLKEELTQPLGKDKLIEMIKLSGLPENLRDEFKMALGALSMGDKMVRDSMTKAEHCFMLPSTLTLNPVTVNQILEMGYTRVPIYETDRNNVVAMLSVKDLALVDPDDNINVLTLCRVYNRRVRYISEETPLRCLLAEFKKGEYHIAVVFRLVTDSDTDPRYEIAGLITLEDIIEEILQTEIVDETDTVMDNVQRKIRPKDKHHDLSQLLQNMKCVLSVQMQVCAFQFLPSFHEAFDAKYIHEYVLEKLIRQHAKKVETSHLYGMVAIGNALPKSAMLYTNGEVSDKFIIVLQGCVTVEIGQEKMVFEARQWHAFGSEVLDGLLQQVKSREDKMNSEIDTKMACFVPDFTAYVRNECTFLEVSIADWQAAYKTSILARSLPQEVSVRITANQCADDMINQPDGSFELQNLSDIANVVIPQKESALVELAGENQLSSLENGSNEPSSSDSDSTPMLNRSTPPVKPPRGNDTLNNRNNTSKNGVITGYFNGEEIELVPTKNRQKV